MLFLRINLPISCSLNSIKANRDHVFFCSKQDFNKSTVHFYHRLCIYLQACLVERYCITVPPCPDIIWGNGVPPEQKYLGKGLPRVPLHYTTGNTTLVYKQNRYDTIRDAILMCARKPTRASLIYHTEPTTKKCKTH